MSDDKAKPDPDEQTPRERADDVRELRERLKEEMTKRSRKKDGR